MLNLFNVFNPDVKEKIFEARIIGRRLLFSFQLCFLLFS